MSTYMPAGEPRCSAAHCPQSGRCIRSRAPYEQGRPVTDYSANYGWVRGYCVQHRPPGFWPEPGRVKPARPVHEAPEGLL